MGVKTCFSCWLPNCHTKDCYKNGLGRDLSVLVLALTCDSPVGRCFFTAIQKTLLRQYQLRLADAPTGRENVDTRMKWFLTPVTAPDGRYKYYWPSHRDRPVTTGQIVVAFWVKGCMGARDKRWDNSPPAPCARQQLMAWKQSWRSLGRILRHNNVKLVWMWAAWSRLQDTDMEWAGLQDALKKLHRESKLCGK